MRKRKANRTNEVLLLVIVCVGVAVLGFALGNSHTVTAKAARPPSQKSDEKFIERKEFPNEPFRLGDLSVKRVKIIPREKFSAKSIAESGGGQVDDWLESLTFTIKNISNKRMTYINVEMDFPETAVNGPMMVYNQLGMGIHPKAFGDRLKYGTPLALDSGGTSTFYFSTGRMRLLKEFLASRNFQLGDLNFVTIRIDHVIFDDGMKWSQGDVYKPNPAARGGYERINLSLQ